MWPRRSEEHKKAVKRECNRRWAAANPEKAKASGVKWRETHREQKKADNARWAAENPEKARESQRRWWAKQDQGLAAAYTAAWRERHPERAKESQRRFWASAAGRMLRRVHASLRRARARSSPGQYTRDDVMFCLTLQGWRCFYCLASLYDAFEVDHMTPLSRGGSNGPENIVCACPSCNVHKYTKTAAEFILGNERADRSYLVSPGMGHDHAGGSHNSAMRSGRV